MICFSTITSGKEKRRTMKQPSDKSTLVSCFGPGHAIPDVVRNLNDLILQEIDMSKMIQHDLLKPLSFICLTFEQANEIVRWLALLPWTVRFPCRHAAGFTVFSPCFNKQSLPWTSLIHVHHNNGTCNISSTDLSATLWLLRTLGLQKQWSQWTVLRASENGLTSSYVKRSYHKYQ